MSPREEEVLRRFDARPATDNQRERLQEMAKDFKFLTLRLLGRTPPSREQALALTHLEDAAMWASKAIMHNEGGDDGKPTP